MNFKSLLAALFISSCFLTSCSKDDDKADPAPATQQPTNNNPQTTTPGITAKINNVDWTAAIPTASYQSNNLTIGGGSMNGQGLALSTQSGTVTQPGTYSAMAVYTEMAAGSTSNPTWMSPAGTLTVTKLDVTNKKVSGSFSFTAVAMPNTGATGTKTVTSGTFTDITFQ